MRENSIIASGVFKDIGCPVIHWNHPRGYSFYKNGKYSARDLKYLELIKEIDSFVLHHSVTYNASATYNGLVARGLSVNFIIDDDIDENGYATIYQCLDMKDAGWSHKPLNNRAPGVEICYYPNAWSHPNLYSEENIKKNNVQPHNIIQDTIHGHTMDVFMPTDAQIKSCAALLWGVSKLFPNIRASFPKENNEIVKGVVKDPSGFLSHFNITTNKVDPMGFPFEKVEAEVNKKNRRPFGWSFLARLIDRMKSR